MFLLKQFQNLIKIVSNRSEDINNYIDLIWMKWNVHPLLGVKMFLLKQFQNLIKIVSNRSEDINNYIDLIWMKWNVQPLLETVENLWFSVNFKVYRKEILPWIGLRFLCLEVFCKKAVLKNFAKFTGKYLCQSLFLNKVAGLRHPVLYDFTFFHTC